MPQGSRGYLAWIPSTDFAQRPETYVISLHRTAQCTGVWRREHSDSLMFWRCDTCRALAASSKEVNRAVIQENVLGRELEQLAAEGRRLLEGA